MTRRNVKANRTQTAIGTIVTLALASVVLGCANDGEQVDPFSPVDPPEGASVAASSLERDLSPEVPVEGRAALRTGNRAFALDLYRHLRASEVVDDNIFFSPHSVSVALAMTYAGAVGDTESQMAEVMHYDLPESTLHEAFNDLALALASRSARLDVVNATWGQVGWRFLPEYLDTLALNYGAAMYLLDYVADPETCRGTINSWVAEQTEDRIEELLAEGLVTTMTRLVLTNAVYFDAAWQSEFDEAETRTDEFALADGTTTTVDMMYLLADLEYGDGDGFAAVELPYEGGELSMVAVLPEAGNPDFDATLDVEALDAVVDSLHETEGLEVRMPRFTFGAEIDLDENLSAMGMIDAFDPMRADFSDMDGSRDLYVSDAVHQAWIEVTERGTEAAAATAVVVSFNAAPPSITFDRPFFFFIRDIETGAVLFLGRVADPSAE